MPSKFNFIPIHVLENVIIIMHIKNKERANVKFKLAKSNRKKSFIVAICQNCCM